MMSRGQREVIAWAVAAIIICGGIALGFEIMDWYVGIRTGFEDNVTRIDK